MIFYLGLATLFTHELDAMPNHEWRVMPVLRSFADDVGSTIFLVAHIPIFAVVIALVASLSTRTRSLTRLVASGFLVVHGMLHIFFSRYPAYDFSSRVSSILIYAAAGFGLTYLIIELWERMPNNKIAGAGRD